MIARRPPRLVSTSPWLPGGLLVVAACLVPLAQWLVWQPGPAARAVPFTAWLLWAVTGLGVLALWLGRLDPWLGALAGWATLEILLYPTTETYQAALFLSLGLLGVLSVAQFDADLRRRTVQGLGLAAALHAVLGLVQAVLRPGWPASFGVMTNANDYGAWIALLTPLMPLWLSPLLLAALVSSQCLTGLVAVTVGLLFRVRAALAGLMVLAGAAAFGAAAWAKGPRAWVGWQERLEVWTLALRQTEGGQWLVGHGPGRWKVLVPYWQERAGVAVGDYFVQPHSDWLAWLFGAGAIGVALVLAWAWTHRALMTTEAGGAVATLAVLALGLSPLHQPTVALTALVVLGLALAEAAEQAMHPLTPSR